MLSVNMKVSEIKIVKNAFGNGKLNGAIYGYTPDMEYHCSEETKCDNTVMNRQVDAYVKKL
jgi:hypothetical protein